MKTSHKTGVTLCIIHNDKKQTQPGELERCRFQARHRKSLILCYSAYEDSLSPVSLSITSNDNTTCFSTASTRQRICVGRKRPLAEALRPTHSRSWRSRRPPLVLVTVTVFSPQTHTQPRVLFIPRGVHTQTRRAILTQTL